MRDAPTPKSGSADPTVRREVRSASVAATLESEIVTGQIAPGAKLDEQALTQRFGVSRTPVREALHQLVARSLAERQPYRGVVVAEFTRERIAQMFEAMAEIEALCGRFAALRMPDDRRAELEAVHREMSDLSGQGAVAGYEEANARFHSLIFDGTQNADLVTLGNMQRHKLAPFRKSQLQNIERMARSNQEHAVIVAAILARDPQGAEDGLRRHLASAAAETLARLV
ncbi:GntR family transcriptional regulator [Roseivivax sp. CAU 1753]